MAIAVVNSKIATASGASQVTSTPAFASTALNLLIACGVVNGSSAEGTPPFANVGADTWSTGNKSGNIGGDPDFSDIAWAKNINGNASETVTFKVGSLSFPTIVALEVSGYNTTTPNDIAPSWTSTTSGTSMNSSLITPAAGQHLIVACCQNDAGDATDSQTITNNGTGAATWTLVKGDFTATEPICVAYAVVTADGAHTYGVTYGGYNQTGGLLAAIVGIASFSAAAAAAATFPFQRPARRDPWHSARAWAANR